MPKRDHLFAMLVALLGSILSGGGLARAETATPITVASGVRYEFLARWDAERLNRILTQDMPRFSGLPVAYTPARNAVRLYRVTYPSVIPEQGNRPTVASGLVAVPDEPATAEPTAAKSTIAEPTIAEPTIALPLVSYQHGTVYGKEEVPSFPEQSPETQTMIAQFAGQGYALIGADYFGLGTSTEPEGYMVKASHQQATADMLAAGRAVLADLKRSPTGLFLAGWSQGGFVTMALLERLEATGIPVAAAATASAPVDVFVPLNGFLNFPRKNDAAWVNSLFILSAFAFENYYSVPGLARSVLKDDSYDLAKAAYERKATDPTRIPTDLHALIRAEYFDPHFFASSAYGRLVAQSQAYRWVIRSPVRNFYGETDEAITPGLGQLAATYQRAFGNTRVEAVSTGDTTHRGTFARAVPQWKAWFDSLAR